MSRKELVASVAAFTVLALLPSILRNDFYLGLVTQILIYGLCALSLNVLVGYGGLTSLGHAAFLGIAAYGVPLLISSFGLGHLSAALLTILLTTLVAAAFGVLALQATGLGFLMITLALGQICWGVAYRWVEVTNGENGVSFPVRPRPFGIAIDGPEAFYYFTLVVFAAGAVALWRLVHAPFGASIRGTRDQPRRMRMLGYNVGAIQLAAFTVSGFWGAVSGVMFIYYYKFTSPYAVSLQQSAELLLMTLLGGATSFVGPIVGAVVITLVKNVASSYVERWNALLGVIFVASVVLMPRGIVPGVMDLFRPRARPAAPADEASPPARERRP